MLTIKPVYITVPPSQELKKITGGFFSRINYSLFAFATFQQLVIACDGRQPQRERRERSGWFSLLFEQRLGGIKVSEKKQDSGAVENGEIASSLRFSQRHKVHFSMSCAL